MKRMLTIIAVVIAVAAVAVFYATRNPIHETQLYTCPMHPYYITDKPGDCPICGMKLVKVEKSQVPDSVQLGNTVNAGAATGSMAGMENETPADRVVVRIDPEKQQLINIRTDTVGKRKLGNAVTATGVVAYDPELYYTQQQYISDLLTLKKAQAGGNKDSIGAAREALNSETTRLKVMGLSDAQIKELDSRSAPDKSLLISDQGGSFWVYAQVYQDDLKYVKRGAEAEVSLSSAMNNAYTGRVVAIDPALNPETRSVRVRILVNDASGVFKPEMYVNVSIKSPAGEYLSVPEEAILDTGTKEIAFVDMGGGYFEPRYVSLGANIGGYYVVQFGLNEGEKVVTNANFLIDSESQLKAALGQMSTHKH